MARINNPVRSPAPKTHEGGRASRISAKQELERTIMACLLWEDGFYESGESVAERIQKLAKKVKVEDAVAIMKKASAEYKLRHAPLLLAVSLLGKDVAPQDIADIITRADSLTEILALYWKDGKRPLSHKLKKALDIALRKFNAYNFAKYDRDGKVKLRDVLRIVRPKPTCPEQSLVWGQVISRTLPTPDTWETELSAGKNKKAVFERLITEGKLGDLAFLRNLRKMTEEGVDRGIIQNSFSNRNWSWVLPYQFIVAARHAPTFERDLDTAMIKALGQMDKLPGKTALLVDVSGSMSSKISDKSELTRRDAAVALAMLLEGVCPNLRVFAFTEGVKEIPVRRGFGMEASIPKPNGGTRMWNAISEVGGDYDRVIVISDEETSDNGRPCNGPQYYILNVATNANGVGYQENVTHISGFSEASVRYISEFEKERKSE